MMSAKFSDFSEPSSHLSTFASDLCYKIHAISLTTPAFPFPLPLSGADIISGSSLTSVADAEQRVALPGFILYSPVIFVITSDSRN